MADVLTVDGDSGVRFIARAFCEVIVSPASRRELNGQDSVGRCPVCANPIRIQSDTMERSRGQSFGGEERQALTSIAHRNLEPTTSGAVAHSFCYLSTSHIIRGCRSIDNERTKKCKNVKSVDLSGS